MRWLYLIYLCLLMLLDILPIPIIGLILAWVIIFRPVWFYEAVKKIYEKID
jgi:hypothetical protein